VVSGDDNHVSPQHPMSEQKALVVAVAAQWHILCWIVSVCMWKR